MDPNGYRWALYERGGKKWLISIEWVGHQAWKWQTWVLRYTVENVGGVEVRLMAQTLLDLYLLRHARSE